MECDHDGRLQRRLPAGCHIKLSDVRSSYRSYYSKPHRELTKWLAVHTVSNPVAAGVTLHTNSNVTMPASMVTIRNKANLSSQLKAQKQDKHFSHSLGRESEHTVSIVRFRIEPRCLMRFKTSSIHRRATGIRTCTSTTY